MRQGEGSDLEWLMTVTVFTCSLGACGAPGSSGLYSEVVALPGADCPSVTNKSGQVNTWYLSNTKSPERTDPSNGLPMVNPTVSLEILSFTSW